MPKHKSEDFKMSAVEYYLTEVLKFYNLRFYVSFPIIKIEKTYS